MKSLKEIGLGALKVVLYAGGSAGLVALIDYLKTLSLTEAGISLVIINVIIYVLVQITQKYAPVK